MNEYKNVLNDKRVINAICRKYNMKRDETYCYIVDDNNISTCIKLGYKDREYKLEYFSGCFYPYLVEVI